MNPTLSRILKTLCVTALGLALCACGSSQTQSPFVPSRVVGLGDGYNDATATVQEAGSTTGTVVGQVAAYFGQSNMVSRAASGARIRDLAAQIASVGAFTSGDLVVITVGTYDVKAGANPDTEAQTLVTQVQNLKDAGVKHILVMPVLELSRTPWGRANNFDTTATSTFNTAVLTKFSATFGGQSPNTVIYANASSVTSLFLIITSMTPYSPFTDTGYNGTTAGTVPACGDATVFTGCASTAANTNYPTMLFADGINLTPAGNIWVAQYLYNATASGWR